MNEYSLVWWLASLLLVSSLPGILTSLLYLVGLAVSAAIAAAAVALVCGIIYGVGVVLFKMVAYFIENPW